MHYFNTGNERYAENVALEDVVAEAKELGMHLVFAPGRNLVGTADILVAKCLSTKQRGEKNFIMIPVPTRSGVPSLLQHIIKHSNL